MPKLSSSELVLVVLLLLLLSLGIGVALGITTATPPNKPDTSYTRYVTVNHIPPVNQCQLDVIKPLPTSAQYVYVCRGTNKLPTKAQTNVWEGYVLWQSCLKDNNGLSCQELSN